MMTTVVVAASLALGIAFCVAWLLAPSLRRRIEAPKHWFQHEAERYDRACISTHDEQGRSDERG
jgi:hypothetical protein